MPNSGYWGFQLSPSPPKTGFKARWVQVSERTAGEPPPLPLSPCGGRTLFLRAGGAGRRREGCPLNPRTPALSPKPGRWECSPQRPAARRDRLGAAETGPATYPFGCARWRRPRSCHSWSRPRWRSRGSGDQGPPCQNGTPKYLSEERQHRHNGLQATSGGSGPAPTSRAAAAEPSPN